MAQYFKLILSCFIVILLFLPHIVNPGAIRKVSSSISCFQCHSRNWSDTNCHDPFNPAMSIYSENCKVPKPSHIGVFPARFCIKITGRKIKTGESFMIRQCSLKNMDNQCGNFNFEGDDYKGCILTCDYDGCNHSTTLFSLQDWPYFVGFIFLQSALIHML